MCVIVTLVSLGKETFTPETETVSLKKDMSEQTWLMAPLSIIQEQFIVYCIYRDIFIKRITNDEPIKISIYFTSYIIREIKINQKIQTVGYYPQT